jgi:hypothetical protein
MIVRGVLGSLNAFALIAFGRSVQRTFGTSAGVWYALFQASQFHVIYYASRTLPNMFALIFSMSPSFFYPTPTKTSTRYFSTTKPTQCLRSPLEQFHRLKKLPTNPVPSHLCRNSISLRTSNSNRYAYPISSDHQKNLHRRDHHPSWTPRRRHRPPLHCLHRLLLLAILPSMAGMERILLQHHPRPLCRLGCLTMALLLH